MSGQFYDNADSRTYRFPAETISGAGVLQRVIGPAGKVGRVRGFEYIVTTDVTVAASAITVDTNAGLSSPFSTSIAVASANDGGAATAAELKAADDLPADTVIEIATDGGSTAGACDLIVRIDWF